MKKISVLGTLFTCGALLLLTGCNAYHKVTEQKALKLIEEGAKVIDVRSELEYDGGHIPGSSWIPHYKIDTITDAKDTKIIVYCRSGSRSKTAADILVGLGYKNVYDLGSIEHYTGTLEKKTTTS